MCWRVGIHFGDSLESDLSPSVQAGGGEQAAAFGRHSAAEAASRFRAGSSKSLSYHKDCQIVLTSVVVAVLQMMGSTLSLEAQGALANVQRSDESFCAFWNSCASHCSQLCTS